MIINVTWKYKFYIDMPCYVLINKYNKLREQTKQLKTGFYVYFVYIYKFLNDFIK